MRQFKILTSTSTVTLEEYIRAKYETFEDLKVEGFGWDGTNYIVLVSYEV